MHRMSEGLRPRYFDEATMRRLRMCSNENAHNLKWSDWVSCLHARMGMPRWLSAATISLAIIFVIWLCLVIPQNAPKQKVKMTKVRIRGLFFKVFNCILNDNELSTEMF